MITGLEPAILDAAVAGATRAIGWGVLEVRKGGQRSHMRKLLGGIEAAGQAGIESRAISQETLQELYQYLRGPEFAHITYSLAATTVVASSGRKTDHTLSAIRAEFEASVELIVGPEMSEVLSEPIFAATMYAVTVEARKLGDAGSLSKGIRSEASKMISSIAAASARNVEILQQCEHRSEFIAFENELRAQIQSLHGTMKLPHAGTTKQVPYEQLFVSPKLTFSKLEITGRTSNPIGMEDILKHSTRCVILGDPGGGKSTLAMKLVFDVSSDRIEEFPARVPFFVTLRDYAENARGANRVSLIEYLAAICNSPYGINPPEHGIEYLLLNDRALVVFDGLDELIDTSLRRDVVQAVEGFAYRYPTTPIVVTSRRIGYEEASLDSDLFPVAQLREFSQEQVADYAQRWFQLDEDQAVIERQRLTAAFLRDSRFVADLRINPLMLSLMCGIYATENYIPRNRPEVYEKCALLLFERWDKQRGVTVSLPFEAHVHAAMRSLALHMYSQEQPQLIRSDLVRYIKEYLLEKRFDDPDIAEKAAEEFIDFCKGRAWVLTDVGHEKYGFTHRTFLEYFSASQLVRLHPSAGALFAVLRDHLCAREWDAVAQLAVQILGRTVEDGADDFLKLAIQTAATVEGSSRANLLSFASRALQFIVPRPDVLRGIVVSCIRLLSDPSPDIRVRRRNSYFELRASIRPALHLLGASNELRTSLARLIRDELRRSLEESWRNEDLWALAIVPWIFNDLRPEDFIRTDWNYWKQWAKENERFLAKPIALARAKYFWLDLLRLSRGEINIEEVLKNHGASALFDYHVAGYSAYAPIAYCLLGGYSGNDSILSLLGLKRRVSFSRIVEDLEICLPEVPPPWLPYRRNYLMLSEILYRHLTPSRTAQALKRMSDELTFFLAAPLVEMTIQAGWNSRESNRYDDYPALLRTVFNARGNTELADDALLALEHLTTNVSIRETMRRWVISEISFVKIVHQRKSSSPSASE